MAKNRSKPKQGSGSINHKYLPADDDAEAGTDANAEVEGGASIAATTATTATTATATKAATPKTPNTTSYSDDEGNVIIEQYSHSFATSAAGAPVSPIPETTEDIEMKSISETEVVAAAPTAPTKVSAAVPEGAAKAAGQDQAHSEGARAWASAALSK